jgi:hypothetical protein
VLARAPRDGGAVVDLRGVRGRALRLEGAAAAGHYLLEDERGVRLLDFNQTGATAVQLARPAVPGTLYLRHLPDGTERAVRPSDGPVSLGALRATPARAMGRGAAHASFGKVFSLAFDVADVAAYRRREDGLALRLEEDRVRDRENESRGRRRRILGWTAAGGALIAASGATALLMSADNLHDSAPVNEAHRDAVARNEDIAARDRWGTALAVTSAALVGAAVYLLWLRGDHR